MKRLNKSIHKGFAICLGMILCGALPAKAQRTYTVTDLGAVPGAVETNASDINNQGEVIAYSYLSFSSFSDTIGFVSQGGTTTLLPSLGGRFTFASGINQSGVVAGSANFIGDTITHAVTWDKNLVKVTDLGTLGGASSSAVWINDREQVVGYSLIPNGVDDHGFLWNKGTMIDLGTLGGGNSLAFGINDSGLIVGQSDTSTTPDPIFGVPPFHGFRWEMGRMSDLGVIFGGQFNYANAVNDRGDVVGAGDLEGDLTAHAFLLRGESLIDLGTLPEDTNSIAVGVNNRGQVVGFSDLAPGPPFGPPLILSACPCHAVIWENGKVTDLNTVIPASSGWQLMNAFAINERGQVVGTGTLNNELRAFLLTPQEGNSSSSVPSAAQVNSASPQAIGASTGALRVVMDHGKPRMMMER